MARKRRQLVIMGAEKGGSPQPLGTRREFAATLACFNTSCDGGAALEGVGGVGASTEVLYGPGMVVEVPTSSEQVTQAIATISDEDLALPVLMKMCKKLSWRMMDIESGRMFG